MTRRVGHGALLLGAGLWLSACSGGDASSGPTETTSGSEDHLEASLTTFNDYRGTWLGSVQLGPSEHDIRALLLVVGQESLLCERPAVGCVPVEVRIERGRLVFHAELREGGATQTLDGRFTRPDAPALEGTVRSSSCGCEAETVLHLAENESFQGQWEATISFDQVHDHETRQLPTEFRSPEPFVLRVREHGAEACTGAGGTDCVNVEWVAQGPQSAFHFERVYDGVRVRTDGHVGRMSNGRIEGEILRESTDFRRSGRIYLRSTGTGSM